MKKSHSLSNSIGRSFLVTLGITLGVLVTISCQKPASKENSPTVTEESTPSPQQQHNIWPSLALSLTVLQEEVAKRPYPLPDELAHLGSMNHVQGILIEPDGELILFGRHDSEVPPFHLDDVVVVLRNAYQVSAVYQGVLGCTIDPWTGSKDPWRIQQVKVFGMPATAMMAARQVATDYELKKIGAGILPLDGISSQWEMMRSTSPLCEGPADKATETAHRFWFYPLYPPAPRFMEEEGIIAIVKPVGVQLLTEQEFLDRTGKRTGAAPASPLAERFAQTVTELLARNQLRHYAQLRQDFRMIEVAQLLRFKRVPPQSLRYFLQDYPLTEVQTPTFVGGIRREERGEVVCDSEISERRVAQGVSIGSAERVQRYHLTSRGGVEAKVQVAREHFVEERSGTLADLRRRVETSRPAPRTLSWLVAN